jgi:hypothetical protein
MPIDINLLRAEKGGDPEYWRGVMRKRFKDVALVDRVIEQDQVRFCPPATQKSFVLIAHPPAQPTH